MWWAHELATARIHWEKKGYEDKSGLEGPLRGKQLQMCKERNILQGWHCIKNAHSSHRPLEMECYQTETTPPPLIVTQTYTEKEEEEKLQRDRQRWTEHRWENTNMTSGLPQFVITRGNKGLKTLNCIYKPDEAMQTVMLLYYYIHPNPTLHQGGIKTGLLVKSKIWN